VIVLLPGNHRQPTRPRGVVLMASISILGIPFWGNLFTAARRPRTVSVPRRRSESAFFIPPRGRWDGERHGTASLVGSVTVLRILRTHTLPSQGRNGVAPVYTLSRARGSRGGGGRVCPAAPYSGGRGTVAVS
jgi:hypothetical protein